MIDLADVLDVICADENFENRSTHTNMYFLFPILAVTDRQSLILFLIWFFDRWEFSEVIMVCERFQIFTCFNALNAVFAVNLNLAINFRPIYVLSCQTFHRELAWVGFM